MKIILGLGSNIGDRRDYLERAIKMLKSNKVICNLQASKIYKSEALLPSGAPDDWDKYYLNMAVLADCDLSPEMTLFKIKEIEQNIGRVNRGFWSPREIDIDILLYGDLNLISENLTIPHKSLLERDFALLPINDLAPDWIYPREGMFFQQSIKDIIKRNLLNSNCQPINDEIAA
jgi:2-amino-4-hydroxy-6-hydroxymethyldihydropteridine diphosphokinase / dihydropteroate synthase